MPHKDKAARNEYMRQRRLRIKEENPELAEQLAQKEREAALRYRNKNVEKARSDFKKWYYQNGGKEKQRESHGYKPWSKHIVEVKEKRKEAAAYMKEWTQTIPGRRAKVAQTIKKRCGLTIQEYDEAYTKQEGKCKICFKFAPQYGNDRLAVDHDHATDKFRGLLCGNCNTGLGMLGDNVENLKNAIAYLTQGS